MNSTHIVNALTVKHKKDFYLEQVKTGSTWGNKDLFQLDMWVMKLQWKLHTIGYEIKVSRNDFVNDTKWPNYLKYCNQFSWVCPDGMIKRDEIDPSTGLIYVNEDGGFRTVKRALFRDVQIPPDLYRYIIMWRLYARPIERRTNQEIIQDYLDGKIENLELSRRFKSKLVQETVELQKELNRLNIQIENWKELMDNHNPWSIQTRLAKDDEYVNIEFLQRLKSMIEREISIKSK